MSYEQEIIDRHSTPGLRRNELTRYAKKEQLDSLNVPAADRDKILEELYGSKP